MSPRYWKLGVLAIIGIATISVALAGNAETNDRDALVKEWLTKYHDANSLYVIFPNGQIFAARAKRTGILIGRLNLWHCFSYMCLRYRGDEDIYLRGRVINFVDADASTIAARYRTQCALRSYGRHSHKLELLVHMGDQTKDPE